MSTTYDLVCDDCQQRLWIGQRSAGDTYPYLYATPAHLLALTAFLIVHENHHIMFGFDGGFPIEPQGPLPGEDYRTFLMSDIPEQLIVERQLIDEQIAKLRDVIEY